MTMVLPSAPAAGTLPSGRSVAFHESHHVAGLVVGGVVPTCVRIDEPDGDTLGAVKFGWGDGVTPEKARAVLVAVLVASLSEGAPLPAWPVDPAAAPAPLRHDIRVAATLAEFLELDLVSWSKVCWEVHRLARDRSFRKLVVAITDALERVEVLSRDDVLRIATATREDAA